jgi:pSer/pThr/pTyr-binding forkhead associated (FHA) protein
MRAMPPTLRSQSGAEVKERLEAERRGTPFVLYRDGEGGQRLLGLDTAAREISIGRGAASDVPLAWDAEVSRVHALLERLGDAWTIVDDGLSRNGTYVNGERIRGRRRLHDGDVIAVGSTVLAYMDPSGRAALATEPTRAAERPPLSAAQQRVLDALCRPCVDSPGAAPASNREIAEELFIGTETVKTHLHALYELFGIGDVPQYRKRAELVRRAMERGAAGAPA